MKNQNEKKLSSFYHAFLGLESIFKGAASDTNISHHPVKELEDLVNEFNQYFSDILPNFEKNRLFSHKGTQGVQYYNVAAVRVYLSRAIGAIKAEMDSSETTPITEERDFSFISDINIRDIIVRDYQEIQRAFIACCWKSVIILSGGAIETILLDTVGNAPSSQRNNKRAPNEKSVDKWSLEALINVAVDSNLVSPGIEKLSHSARGYRNLVHPGNEIRQKLKFDKEEARITLEILNILQRDLSK